MRTLRPILVLAILILGVPAIGSEEIQLTNWTAPPYWTPPAVSLGDGDQSGRNALATRRQALVTSPLPLPFVAVTPCRQYDSRNTTALADNTSRTVTLSGAPCGIPTTAQAVAVNITVFNISGAGSNGVFKVGISANPPTSWINYPSTETQRANAGVVGTTGAADIVVQVNQGAGSVDFIVDVFGYYAPQNSFCIGADCRTSWNDQDANSVTPLPRNCAPGQVPVATGSYQWKCGNICQALGTADCGGTSCAYILGDPNNCGACALVCQPVANGTPLCSYGVCGFNCNASFTACGSVCRNLATDQNNCGSCNNVCAFGSTCVSGACACPAGQVICGGTCVNPATDPNNCGSCGHTCAVGHACASGVCQ
jgi:Stigma-specific protein, Stig1